MRPGERRNSKFTGHLYSRTLTVNFFRLCWIVLIIWGDLGIYYWHLSSCKWPRLSPTEKPTRVLLVSDPQVQYPLEKDDGHGRMYFTGRFRRFIFDMNLRKNWDVTTRMRPQVVIFLGDMLARGRNAMNEIEYQRHAERFKTIFSLDPSISVYHLPGNGDVGMGVSASSFKTIRSQYINLFGPLNQQIVIHNHTFLLIDAPGLVDEDYQRAGKGVGFDNWIPLPDGTTAFVKSIVRDENPLILLSHIPLARPDSASCGPLREKGTIRRGAGHGYQNTLGKLTTGFLLQSLQPAAVYSGDNRDYCEYIHIANRTKTGHTGADVREVTVKSFSTAKHIRHPGFQLISLINPTTDPNQKSFLDTPCSLPDQYGIYSRVYLPFFLLTMFALVILSVLRRHSGRISRIEILNLSPRSSGTSTPDAPLESATWSPYTPLASNTFPSSLRTPTTLAHPTFRVSRPATPVGSPLPPIYYSHDDDDDDEAMYPPHYVVGQDRGQSLAGEEWFPRHNRVSSEPIIPRFTSAPAGSKPIARRGWSYSWTFVFRGRRRRMTISAPTFSLGLLKDVGELLEGEERTSIRHHILRTTLRDGIGIFSVVVVVWVLLSWRWMF